MHAPLLLDKGMVRFLRHLEETRKIDLKRTYQAWKNGENPVYFQGSMGMGDHITIRCPDNLAFDLILEAIIETQRIRITRKDLKLPSHLFTESLINSYSGSKGRLATSLVEHPYLEGPWHGS